MCNNIINIININVTIILMLLILMTNINDEY